MGGRHKTDHPEPLRTTCHRASERNRARWGPLESFVRQSVAKPGVTSSEGTYAMAVGEPEYKKCVRRLERVRGLTLGFDAPEIGGRVVDGW